MQLFVFFHFATSPKCHVFLSHAGENDWNKPPFGCLLLCIMVLIFILHFWYSLVEESLHVPCSRHKQLGMQTNKMKELTLFLLLLLIALYSNKLLIGTFKHSPYPQTVLQACTAILYHTCINQVVYTCRIYLAPTYALRIIFSQKWDLFLYFLFCFVSWLLMEGD